jgi:putative transposase
LLPNHIHLLVTPSRAHGMAKRMQSIGRRSVPYINTTYHRTGTLWEGRYRASVVAAEAYVLLWSRSIERNPVRAAMGAHPAAYPWSSSHWHACGTPDPLRTDHALYRRLGHTPAERQVAYRALCETDLAPPVVQEMRATGHQGRILGTERFTDVIESTLARRVRPGKPGRPRQTASRTSGPGEAADQQANGRSELDFAPTEQGAGRDVPSTPRSPRRP